MPTYKASIAATVDPQFAHEATEAIKNIAGQSIRTEIGRLNKIDGLRSEFHGLRSEFIGLRSEFEGFRGELGSIITEILFLRNEISSQKAMIWSLIGILGTAVLAGIIKVFS